MRVQVLLGPPFGAELSWRRGPLPTILNIDHITHAHVFDGLNRRALLSNVAHPTALERSDGNWGAAVRELSGPGISASLAELTAAYNTHVWPARSGVPNTRGKNWSNWVTVLTWAVARKAMPLLLPMSVDTLKALSWDLIAFGASCSQILAVWSAIQSRHRWYSLPEPIHGRGEFSAWARSIGTITGRPMKLKFPIHKAVVQWLLRWRPTRVAVNRDRILTALATIACMRVSEVARLQSCDLWFDHFTGYGVGGFEGSCAVHVAYRKNDSVRKGHLPGIGRSRDPELDLVWQLRVWLRQMQLEPRAGCTKRALSAARCPVCPPLFPCTTRAPGYLTISADRPMSPQQVGQAIRSSVASAGCDPQRFSGISARKGGLSTAISAGVDEVVLYLQSGHGPERAARRYMQLLTPEHLMETFWAFEL